MNPPPRALLACIRCSSTLPTYLAPLPPPPQHTQHNTSTALPLFHIHTRYIAGALHGTTDMQCFVSAKAVLSLFVSSFPI
jgi:hypothetical protein